MTRRWDWFVNFEKKEYSRVKIGNGTYIKAVGHGNINILAFHGKNWNKKHLEKVLYVPTLHTNLFSSGVLTERGMVVIEDK